MSRYDREWLARVASGLNAIRGAGFALALLMALAAAVTVAAVVRLGLHARRDEIEIMKLVGSPVAFIRGPFIAEGLLQGGLGARASRSRCYGLGFAPVRAWWGGDLTATARWRRAAVPARVGSWACSSRAGCWWARRGFAASTPRRLIDGHS